MAGSTASAYGRKHIRPIDTLVTQQEVPMPADRKGRGRGFASMDPNKQREIASKGGRAAHVQGTAHEWNSDEARAAGRKGGAASRHRAPGR
jgi:general stress protein YciG